MEKLREIQVPAEYDAVDVVMGDDLVHSVEEPVLEKVVSPFWVSLSENRKVRIIHVKDGFCDRSNFVENLASDKDNCFDEHCHHCFGSCMKKVSVDDEGSIDSDDESSSSEHDADITSDYEPPLVSPLLSLI